MVLPNRNQFNTQRDNFVNTIRGSRRDGRMLQARTPYAEFSTPQRQTPTMFPQYQRLREMGNALYTRINSDPFIQRINQQQQQLGFAAQQRQQGYINSLQQFFNTAPPELRQFLSSPQVMQNLVMSYQRQQPEIQQIQNLVQQQNQYIQTNYGREQKRLQDLQMQFNQQQQRAPTPIEQPQQDPIVDPLRPSTTVPKTITPIERPPIQPIVDPKRESFTPDTPTSDNKGMVVDPLRPIERPPVQPIVDPKRKSFTPATTTSDNKGMVVDPLRPSAPPTQIKTPPPRPTDTDPNNPYKIRMTGPTDPKTPTTPTTPIGDPIKIDTPTIVDPYAPTTTGLMSTPKKKSVTPSQYKGIDTNVKGLMRQ
mgnify:CR=1 FL=1